MHIYLYLLIIIRLVNQEFVYIGAALARAPLGARSGAAGDGFFLCVSLFFSIFFIPQTSVLEGVLTLLL